MSDKEDIGDISKVLTPLTIAQMKTLKKQDLLVLLQGEQKLRLQFQTFYNEAVVANVE